MARLVVKIKYMKPSAKRTMGRYAKYIGTREGVAKIDDSQQHHPASAKQKDLIAKIITDFPALKTSPEYLSYQEFPTKGRATELIERALEESCESETDAKTYADYIATRPRAERFGKHGLFTDDGVEINLEEVSRKLNAFEGTIWTAIVSLKRDDAHRLGFDTGARWRDILRAHRDELAANMKIRPSSFRWYGAFHDESYHPHVHLILYDRENNGYLSKDGVENIKSMFAHAIFQDEMFMLEKDKSDRRDELRLRGKDEIEEIISRIKDGSNDNIILQAMLLDLAQRLRDHKGKKKYSYLKPKDKKLVDSIVDEIGRIPAVEELYFRWYEKQEQLSMIYKTQVPPRLPLSANPVFKNLRNHVISEAGDLLAPIDEEVIDIGREEKTLPSPTPERAIEESDRIKKNNPDPARVALVTSRLLNQVSRIFRDQFSDNPKQTVKVERKLRQKIREKEQAHGIKHG